MTMTTLRFVLGDHLTRDIASLADLKPGDVVLMVEVAEETTYVPHHKQKIALILSAMRHFAQALREEGVVVDYVELDAPENAGGFVGELRRAVARHRATRVVVAEPGEWRVRAALESADLGAKLEIREDDRFFATTRRFAAWARGRSGYRMEFFYREMRRAHSVLMEGEEPVGGRWNFDAENRKPPPKSFHPDPPPRFAPDLITQDVLKLVGTWFADHFGDLEPFGWAVTRDDALKALDAFVGGHLPDFGDHQDAMAKGEPFLHHATLSPYLNIGLLSPREVCAAAERAYARGEAPLNAVEGFIRQILGWREYMRGLYWLKMPEYAQSNALDARRPLPGFYWTGETKLACVAEVVGQLRRHAYAHHIQRLMVTGNLALIAGFAPVEVEAWYLAVFADAYDWVELPNTHGMSLFADGGVVGSKPYAASGAYINRMSNYCGSCVYDPKIKSGDKACPFNPLYWDFLARNRTKLAKNPRMAMPYRTLDAMSQERRAEIKRDATAILEGDDFAASPDY
jgi:deoxyribodipyrimidine photolyase-related protein